MSIIERALAKASSERQQRRLQVDRPSKQRRPVVVPHPETMPMTVEATATNPLLVALSSKSSVITEQYRSLRTKLLHLKSEGSVNTFMITSAVPEEGKTLTAVNLALTITQSFEQTVLLIDADLRSPGVHTLLGVRSTQGLSEYLQGGIDLSACLVRLAKVDRLTILPAGSRPANPAELLGSEQMIKLLREIKHRYEDHMVLIDTPPVLPITDASLLAPRVDGVIFVVRAGKSPRDVTERALSQLNGANVLGVVLNDAERLSTNYYDAYTHYATS